MTAGIDIVDRLRIIWTSASDRINDERAEAANEIERLRAERKEAQIAFLAAHMDLLGRFETMRNERDDARREICKTVVFPSSPSIYAAQRGWDCYRDVQP